MQQIDLVSQHFKKAPWESFASLRSRGPLIHGKLPLFGKCWFAFSYNAVSDILRDQESFARDASRAGRRGIAGIQWWMPRSLTLLANNMLSFDGDQHRRLRCLVDQAFQKQNVETMRHRIGCLVDQHLDRCEALAASEKNRPVDLVRNFARPLPLAVICELLGLPEADRDKFSGWAESSLSVASAWGIVRAIGNLRKMIRYVQTQIESAHRDPRPGLLSSLIEVQSEGERMSEQERLAMVFLLLLAGHETTAHLISGGLLALLEHPQQKQRFVEDPGLTSTAVHELLRYTSPVQLTKPRFATRSLEFHGRQLDRGEMVMAVIAAANCDPHQFDQPDQLLIDRQPNYHLGFGAGIHVCLGMKLALAETEIALTRILRRFPALRIPGNAHPLRWHRRIGMRALQQLPVQLQPLAT